MSDSDSSGSDIEQGVSEEECLLDDTSGNEADLESEAEEVELIGLEGYAFEPVMVVSSTDDESDRVAEEEEEEEEDDMNGKRKGNIFWCGCGRCRAMDTEVESVCCKEFSNIPPERYEGETNY